VNTFKDRYNKFSSDWVTNPVKSIKDSVKIGICGAIVQFSLLVAFDIQPEEGGFHPIAWLAALTWVFGIIIIPLSILVNYYREKGFKLNIRNSQIVIGIFVLIGIFPIEITAYYTFIRIFVTGLSLAIAFEFYQNKKENTIHPYGIVFIILAIFYNPIIPFHFEKEIWIPINGITFLILFTKSLFFDSWEEDK